MNHSDSIVNITQKIIQTSRAIGAIKKAQMQGGQNANYLYFANEQIMAAVSEHMDSNNMWIVQGCTHIDTSDIALVYHFVFMVIDGDSGEWLEVPFSQSNGSGAYQFNKEANAVIFKSAKDQTAGMIDSYAYKNFVLKLFGISTPDADTQEAIRIEKEMQEQRYREQAAERSAAKSKPVPSGDVPATIPPDSLNSTEPRTPQQNASMHKLYNVIYQTSDDKITAPIRRAQVAVFTKTLYLNERHSSTELTEGEMTHFLKALETMKSGVEVYGFEKWETEKELELCARASSNAGVTVFQMGYTELEKIHSYLLGKIAESKANADRRL